MLSACPKRLLIQGDGFKEGPLLAEQRAVTEDLWPLAQPIMPRSLR